jgi:hypothetical protein
MHQYLGALALLVADYDEAITCTRKNSVLS